MALVQVLVYHELTWSQKKKIKIKIINK
ncbi:hypothetical protein RB653_006555 [Dictyostelium firmibasis]|uniref:Uncharacterized protein n=1 Tax=Dictyostelium firmibasis TaxID=79012 RepID=A0AAN7YTV2_9MYCE